jgi:hypothetical protein
LDLFHILTEQFRPEANLCAASSSDCISCLE